MAAASDPARRAIEKAVDTDREVKVSRTTARLELPLPGGKRVSAEVTHESARVTGKRGN